jgi:hypothetical protein
MPWGALVLTAGFAVRAYGAWHYDNLDVLIANTVLIMSGPPVYALINYMVLGRLLHYVPYLSPMHPGRVLTTFLAADGLCEILIIQGAQRMVNTRLSAVEQKVGGDLVKAALIMQAMLFAIFILLGAIFHHRSSKARVLTKGLRSVLIVMYISSLIITARCIYRIVEFFEGYQGEVFTHETYFWVFEASIMFANTAMLNIWHPGRHLPRSNKVFLAQDGVTEMRGPGWEDSRPWLVTLMDPFDVVGLCTGRDKKTRFWELPPAELEALVSEQQRKKIEARNKPRKSWEKLMDPLHIFGPGGRIRLFIDKLDGDDAKTIIQSSKAEVQQERKLSEREMA